MRRQPLLAALRVAPGAAARELTLRRAPRSVAEPRPGAPADRAEREAWAGAALAVVLAAAVAVALSGPLLLVASSSRNLQFEGFACVCAAIIVGVAGAQRAGAEVAGGLARLLAVELGLLSLLSWRISRAGVSWYPDDGVLLIFGTCAMAGHAASCLRRDALPKIPEVAAVAAFALAALPFLPATDLSPRFLAGSALLAAAVALALARPRSSVGHLRALRVCVDLLVPVLLLLLVNDLSYTVPFGDVQHHLNFYVGPVNDVLHGKTVLVNTFSQYGVGVVYALAGLFALPGMHLGYGPLQLVIAVATALELMAFYALLRLTVRSQLLAVSAVALAVAWSVFNTISFVSYPSSGVLRFGPPFALVVLLALASRRPAGRVLALAPVGAFAVCSIWSFEVCVYATAGVGAYVVAEAALARDVRVLRRLIPYATAAVLAMAALVLVTLLRSGQDPSFGTYLAYVTAYAKGHLAWVPLVDFSPSLALALGLLTSAAATATLCIAGGGTTRERRSLPVIAAITAVGIAEFTWFVDRSSEGVEAKLGLTAIAAGALWLDLLLADRARLVRGRAAIVALLCGVGAMLALGSVSATTTAFGNSALATLIRAGTFPPGRFGLARNASLGRRLAVIWSSPVVFDRPAESDAESLLRRPASGPVVVLLAPELTTQVLVRSNRTNGLPIATPSQDALIAGAEQRFVSALSRLPPGTVLLTDREAMSGGLPRPPVATNIVLVAQYKYLVLRRELIGWLRTHRRLVPLASTASGLVLLRLEPLTPPLANEVGAPSS